MTIKLEQLCADILIPSRLQVDTFAEARQHDILNLAATRLRRVCQHTTVAY